MTHILHINDNNLLLQQGTSFSRSQGYAWLHGDDVLFDSNPERSPVMHCRLLPQEVNNRYWQQCDQSTISANGAGMRHAADLIWKHLGELKQQHDLNELVIVAPSHYRERNLKMLLGVAKSCSIQVVGLVNKAVLSLQDRVTEDGQYLHIDVQMHQTVTTQVSVMSGVVKLGSVEVLQDVGIHSMQESLLKGLQQSFIQNDRFDPLHDAATEQQLFDQLPHLAGQIIESGKASVGVQHQGRLHSTSIEAKDWNQHLEPYLIKLLKTGTATGLKHVFVDLNAAFDDSVPESLAKARITVLGRPGAVPTNLMRSEDDSGLIYLTELPLVSQAAGSQAKATTTDQAPAQPLVPAGVTHLLQAGRAISISQADVQTADNTLTVHAGKPNVQHLLSSGQLYILNDEGRQEMRPNDRIGSHIADGVITAIQVI
jgi:hypothetical protein